MGMKDYEYYANTRIDALSPTGEVIKKTLLEQLKENKEFIKQYSEYLKINNRYGNIINRPIFKYTKLREEIFFITTKIKDVSTNNTCNFVFAVNEKSFSKRFRVYKNNDHSNILGTRSSDVESVLKNVISDSNNYNIRLNILGFEKEAMETIYNNISPLEKDILDKLYIKNNNIIEIKAYYSYSKLLWLSLFDSLTASTDLIYIGDYKTAGSPAYYDVDRPENIKYRVFVM